RLADLKQDIAPAPDVADTGGRFVEAGEQKILAHRRVCAVSGVAQRLPPVRKMLRDVTVDRLFHATVIDEVGLPIAVDIQRRDRNMRRLDRSLPDAGDD